MDLIRIDPATPEDTRVVADIVRAQVPRYGEIMPLAFERWADKVSAGFPASMTFEIIRRGHRAIGFIGTTQVSPEILYLQALYFFPESQRRGFGAEVMARIAARARKARAREIVLQAHQLAHWAISFYVKRGFALITDDLDEIRQYGDGILRDLALPSTVLLSLPLKQRDSAPAPELGSGHDPGD